MTAFLKKTIVVAVALFVFGLSAHGVAHADDTQHNAAPCLVCRLSSQASADVPVLFSWAPVFGFSDFVVAADSYGFGGFSFLVPPSRAPPVA